MLPIHQLFFPAHLDRATRNIADERNSSEIESRSKLPFGGRSFRDGLPVDLERHQ
jgi:hypothetical protein